MDCRVGGRDVEHIHRTDKRAAKPAPGKKCGEIIIG
jgi:hypothetical protein